MNKVAEMNARVQKGKKKKNNNNEKKRYWNIRCTIETYLLDFGDIGTRLIVLNEDCQADTNTMWEFLLVEGKQEEYADIRRLSIPTDILKLDIF